MDHESHRLESVRGGVRNIIEIALSRCCSFISTAFALHGVILPLLELLGSDRTMVRDFSSDFFYNCFLLHSYTLYLSITL